jgi:general secretion pathway protein A
MYTPYYGFREKPFALSPDPRFLFLSASHREVLGHLVYGIEQGEGFMAISGEVGTGKTTLCRTLLRRLGSESEVAFIFNPTLTPLELLKAINSEFELSTFGNSRPELTDVLNTFLLEKRSEGRGVLLIVDEAQNLSTETLEQLRLLSNLETETSKLLQIVLLGQPELDEKLATKELRQLRQRISVWWHLGPLDAAETREYVRHRLRVAGALERPIFTDAALRAVHQISRGVPRVVNLLCDRALLAGYADQKAQIGRRLVLRAAVELRPQRSKRGLRRAWIGATALALLLFGGVALTQVGSWSRKDSAGPPVAAGSPVEAPVAMSREWADVSAAKPPTPNRPRPMAIVDGELDPVLAWQTPEQSRAETLHATLAAWDLPIAELDVTSFEALRSALASRGIALLPILPELPALRDAGTPAIVSLRDRSGVPRLALLRSLAGDTAHVAGLARGVTIRVPTDDLMRHLDGEVYAVWRNFENLPEVLRLGEKGPAVRWLQSALADLGFYTGSSHGSFDEETRNAVALFQRKQGIPPEGEVDARTLMALYAALPRYATPQLVSDPVDLASAR